MFRLNINNNKLKINQKVFFFFNPKPSLSRYFFGINFLNQGFRYGRDENHHHRACLSLSLLSSNYTVWSESKENMGESLWAF